MSELPREPSPSERLYVRPTAISGGEDAAVLIAGARALPLAGGPLAFGAAEVAVREPGARDARRATVPVGQLARWGEAGGDLFQRVDRVLRRIVDPRPLVTGRPRLMGIVNVTPDSFSDGGEHLDPDAAVERAIALADAGAGIVDIGGESTRPGAEPVTTDEELRRVVPVLDGLRRRRGELGGALVSIDTRKAAVMRAALAAGADILNDVSALGDDPHSIDVAVESGAPVVLMHLPLPPAEMRATPDYADVALDVFDHLHDRVEACVAAGVDRRRIIVDPGFGFGKRGPQNLALLQQLALFHGLGCPLMVGLSRKGIGDPHHRDLAPKQRLPGSLAAAVQALDRGAQILRVHDVAESRQAVSLWAAVNGAE